MTNPIVQDTKLQCSQGTEETPIQVTSQTFVGINSKLQATEEDKQAGINIIPFGKCKLKQTSGGYLSCSPDLIKWQKTSPFSIDGKKELTTESFCMCSTGGKVTPLPSKDSSFESIG